MTIASAEILVRAPVKQAYRAFTNATSMREWLCDASTVAPHPGGRMYLWWRGDFYSSGHYLELDEGKRVKFRWFSNLDPVPTEVVVTLSGKDGATLVRIEHEIPDDLAWAGKAESFRSEWTNSLENLKSVLETGIDLRFANRPLLGIIPGDFTEEQAKALDVPVREGIRLDDVVEGMGAQKSGLQKDDVLVEFAGQAVKGDTTSLPAAIAGKKGGDVVKVVFYRGAEKKTVAMELTKRPMPDVPFDPVELEKQARALYEPALAEVEKCFKGYNDAEAMRHPAPNEWSALETIAHLINAERFNLLFLSGLINGYEFVADGFGDNIHAQVQATVRANPSITGMLDVLRRSVEETLIYISLLPAEFVANKGSYRRFAAGLLEPNYHITAHLPQIRDALAEARK